MRQILFRGKRIDNGEWVVGSLILNGEYTYAIYDCNEHSDYNGVEVDYKTIGQYSGLEDNWKNKIWEGDNVKILYTDWPSKSNDDPRTLEQYLEDIAIPGQIVFYNGEFCIEIENTKYGEKDYVSISPGKHGFVKVIGNIHEPLIPLL